MVMIQHYRTETEVQEVALSASFNVKMYLNFKSGFLFAKNVIV